MLRIANLCDLDRIEEIYNEIHTEIEAGRAVIGWVRGVYPTRALAENSIRLREMYVLEREGEIVACGRINRYQGAEYDGARWNFEAAPDEVLVLHTLVVSPRCKGRGCGTEFVAYYENMARREGLRTLRLDTNALNLPARALYKKLGYAEACIVPTEFNGIKNVRLVCLDKRVQGMDVSTILRRRISLAQGKQSEIDRFIRVHAWARMIAMGENLDADARETVEIAALLLGMDDFPHTAKAFLRDAALPESAVHRIIHLAENCHDGADAVSPQQQILREAMYLANAAENDRRPEALHRDLQQLFQTPTGIALAQDVYVMLIK